MKLSRGFTLIEVVVALTILSLISLATVTALRTIAMTKERLEQTSARTTELRVISSFLRRVLVDALPVIDESSVRRDTLLKGSASELIWVAPFSASRRFGGIMLFRLYVHDSSLMLETQPFYGSRHKVTWDSADPFLLVPDLDSIEFSYFQSGAQEWLDSWFGRPGNPDRIRIRVMAGKRYWPDIIVRLNDIENVNFH